MNRTLASECFSTAGMTPGEVLVATGFHHPGRGYMRCAAALRLAETARTAGGRSWLVETPGDIRPEWVGPAATITMTAGLGAAPGVVTELIDVLSGLGPLSLVDRRVSSEILPAARPVPLALG
jgi:hypothetical protein